MLLQQAELSPPSLPRLTDQTRQFSSRLGRACSSHTSSSTLLSLASDQTQDPSRDMSLPDVQNSLRLLLTS